VAAGGASSSGHRNTPAYDDVPRDSLKIVRPGGRCILAPTVPRERSETSELMAIWVLPSPVELTLFRYRLIADQAGFESKPGPGHDNTGHYRAFRFGVEKPSSGWAGSELPQVEARDTRWDRDLSEPLLRRGSGGHPGAIRGERRRTPANSYGLFSLVIGRLRTCTDGLNQL
jgi:hypothetical protein